ncbi:MAG TPA: ribosome maturation factor RimM [Vicinamibacterales bacterium]|jgi:16S rRNA processing protein RimM
MRIARDAPPEWEAMVVVGRVARPHGIRGQVIVNPETDFVEERFRVGAELFVLRHGAALGLRVRTVRLHRGRPIIGFHDVDSIEAIEWLAGGELRVPAEALRQLPAHEFYRHDLVGCRVTTTSGRDLGTVTAVEGPREGSYLIVRKAQRELLVPLAAEICVVIDARERRIVIEPPEGLIELNETGK